MTDLSKIRGEVQPPEPERGKRREKKEIEEIKEKWSKVGKVDPDQRKRKKPKAQKEAEAEAEYAAPKQGLEGQPPGGPSIYEPEGGGLKIPEEGEGGRVAGAPPSYSPPDYLESEIIPEEEQPPEKERETQRKEAPRPPTERKKAEKGKGLEKKKKVAGAKAPAKGPEEAKKKEEPGLAPPAKKVEKKAEEKEAMLKGAFEAPLEGKVPEEKKPVEKKEEKTPEIPLPPAPPLPEGAWEAAKESEKKEPKEEAEFAPPPILHEIVPPLGAPPPAEMVAPSAISAPFANLPPQVQQLYERMVGVMTVMHETGITQTTINLDNPRFTESVFFGAQIIITEFSTAPKAFNIELLGNQQAVNLISQNSEELVAAFQAGQYNFKVNRIDTGFLPGIKEVRRKEARRVKRKRT